MKKITKRKAVTLIELIIYLTVTSLVLVVVIDLVTRIAQSKTISKGQSEITQNSRFFSDKLSYEISRASMIEGSYPSNELHLNVNGESVAFLYAEGRYSLQEGFLAPTNLTNDTVEFLPVNDDKIFTKVTNNGIESVFIKYKIVFKQSGLTNEFQTAFMPQGKNNE